MRSEHPGRQEDDRHVRSEAQSTANVEPDKMRQQHESQRRHTEQFECGHAAESDHALRIAVGPAIDRLLAESPLVTAITRDMAFFAVIGYDDCG